MVSFGALGTKCYVSMALKIVRTFWPKFLEFVAFDHKIFGPPYYVAVFVYYRLFNKFMIAGVVGHHRFVEF